MNARAVLIGLDGATFSILDPLMDEGVMPRLKELMASGARAELLSVIPPLTPPAWTSLTTGRSPGNHGIFDFFRFEYQNDRYIKVADATDVGCETIWSLVSRQGLTATALNFPLTSPPRPISGYLVPGWVPWRYMRLACRPAGLYEQLKQLPGFDAQELAMDMGLDGKAIEGCQKEEDYESWIQFHIRREQQWFEILSHLMKEDPSDLTAVLFDGVDKLQHFCWRFLDPALLPSQPSAWERKVRELCLDYFRLIDDFVAEIVARAGSDATTVIASDHGFGASVEIFYLNTWLAENGYLAWTDAAAGELDGGGKLGLETMARRFYEVDWARTTAHSPTPSSNGIYIPRADGRGKGGVAPEEYEEFRRRLMESLRGFTCPRTGEPVVTNIWTREEAFAGPFMELAPDLTLGLRDGGFVSILPSETPLKQRREPTGTHRPEGVFVAAGPGIRRGARLERLSILDVAPLLIDALGLPIPEDLEGRVPKELYEPSWTAARRSSTGERTRSLEPPRERAREELEESGEPGEPGEPGEEDGQEEIVQRLKALGYLE
jgi:predicted AlkP superfamily phosphohydrolase/phosphomutase